MKKILKLIFLLPIVLIWVVLIIAGILSESITSLLLVSANEIDDFISKFKP